MKLYIILIFTAIGMAFFTGQLTLILKGRHNLTPQDLTYIQRVKREFPLKVPANGRFDFGKLHASTDFEQLADPASFENDSIVPFLAEDSTFASTKNCFKGLPHLLNFFNFEKVILWEEFRCGNRKTLPKNFFNYTPYIHPSGNSFAYLAYNNRKGPYYKDKSWAKEHLAYFHLKELDKLHLKEGIDLGPFSFINSLDDSVLSSIVHRKGFIFFNKTIYIKNPYQLRSDREYLTYTLDQLNDFLRAGPFVVSTFRKGKNCLLQDEQLCWSYNTRHLFSLASKSTLSFFIFSLIIMGLVVRLLLNKLKMQKIEDERKKMALQVLSHEFRTPIAALLVQLENINKRFDKLDEENQCSFLAVSNNVYRLQRLVEKSRNYLKLVEGKKLLDLKKEKISSINDVISQMLDNYVGQIDIIPSSVDGPLCLDLYWLEICIKNLVENALYHGKGPVKVIVNKNENYLEITVEDQGECQFKQLTEMSSPFIKGTKSEGTGLGLNIVSKIVSEMDGKLIFKPNPTRFIIQIKDIK